MIKNFHCSFVDYDRWKPIVLKLLETIETRSEERKQS